MEKTKRQEAERLRRQGYSFNEISRRLGIAKSTVSVWTRSEALDEAARKRIRELGDEGRRKGMATNARKQRLIMDEIKGSCGALVGKGYGSDDYKLFLALLYWGEGAKTEHRLTFINSDPDMIGAYLWLLRRSFDIEEKRLKCLLHLHDYHDRPMMIDFWSKVTGIPKNNFSVYNKPHTGISKKPGYKGCLSIRYGDSRILKEIFIIIDRFKDLANIAGLV